LGKNKRNKSESRKKKVENRKKGLKISNKKNGCETKQDTPTRQVDTGV